MHALANTIPLRQFFRLIISTRGELCEWLPILRSFPFYSAFGMDQEIPDYDMDVEDELWFLEQAKKMEITAFQFEQMMDRLEKGSGQQVRVVTPGMRGHFHDDQ